VLGELDMTRKSGPWGTHRTNDVAVAGIIARLFEQVSKYRPSFEMVVVEEVLLQIVQLW
jgi:hypothetical protein